MSEQPQSPERTSPESRRPWDGRRPTTRRSRWQSFLALPKGLRVITYVVVGLVLALVLGTAVVVVLVRRPLPQTTGTIDVPGLSAPVEVIRDDHGIPQLYGDSVADLMRAQGYVQAQERFFQMDIDRHVTAGRLSELFGTRTLETDELIRTLGWRRVAERELALVQPETRDALEAFSEGVNAYLDSHDPSQISVEYTLLRLGGLGYTPEPWTPVDSLAWLKAMAWDLGGNMGDEINRVMAMANHTAEQADELYPPYDFSAHAPIVHQGAVVDGVFEPGATSGGTRNPQRPAYTEAQRTSLQRLGRTLARMPAMLGKGDALGSNSWVVDGAHTTTGKPILANDPHLGVSLPGIWIQMGLHCRTVSTACPLDVSGFTFPGTPGIVIGHNEQIAWGFTNLGPDVSDLYLERVRGSRWEYDGRWRPLRTRTETIKVRGSDDVTLTVRSTSHGPLVSDVNSTYRSVASAESDGPGPGGSSLGVSLAWTGLIARPTADAILGLDTATDWDSFRAAASSFAVPAQNLVYADRAGHIGYQAPGLIPIRKSGNNGDLPARGWRPEDDWTGDFVPFDGLPQVLDPKEGFIVTANQAVIGPGYPYHLTDDWDAGYRSDRIRSLLERSGRLSVADMARIQLDTHNPMAPVLTPYLLDLQLPRGFYSDGQRLLRAWDFDQPASSGAAAYYNAVWRNLLSLTFDDELPRDQWPDGGDRWMSVVSDLLTRPTDPWWDKRDTPEVETRDDILREAMIDGRDEMTNLEARSAQEWTWGDIHELDLRNSTLGESGIGPVEALLDRGGWKVGGGDAIVDATAWDATKGFEVTAAPSMRMVVSMADLDASRWINLTGVSGHAGSSHYTDQTDLWAAGRTLPWAFSRSAVDAAGQDVLTLRPADSG